jgi:uncharacterized protein YprB with RNaseH-like and TPR domain
MRPGGSAARNPPYDDEIERRRGAAGPVQADPASASEILGGDLRDGYMVVDRRYPPGHRHGRVSVADSLPSSDSPWNALGLLLDGSAPGGRLVFVDLETTGLAGGAGTCAFLVGCGWFDGASFRVRQLFLSAYAGERALLDALREVAGDAATIVSYNGKSFDLPLIETRFLFHRMETPFAGIPHIDMLHPARRLWRADDDDTGTTACRLTNIEATQLGYVREDDVPGFEIPARYFHYVRTGDARPLCGVLEHNRLDILSLAMVTARAAQLIEDGPAAARTAREALGLGRLYERAARNDEAREAFSRAAAMTPADPATRAEALRACAVLARRARQYEESAAAWRRLLDIRRCPPRLAREAAEALAVHHEHRLRDLEAARRFALDSLQFNGSRTRTAAVQHRLARIDRKLGGQAASAPLF